MLAFSFAKHREKEYALLYANAMQCPFLLLTHTQINAVEEKGRGKKTCYMQFPILSPSDPQRLQRKFVSKLLITSEIFYHL